MTILTTPKNVILSHLGIEPWINKGTKLVSYSNCRYLKPIANMAGFIHAS